MKDVLAVLREFRQSAAGSVVSGLGARSARPQFDDGLETFLCDLVLDQVTSRPRDVSLIVLCGNAGDGKSALLNSAFRRLAAEGVNDEHARWLLDATQSDSRLQSSNDCLNAFFAPFRDDASWNPAALHLIAINTGRCIQYFEARAQAESLTRLDSILRVQMGVDTRALDPKAKESSGRVLVIDLDRRAAVDPAFPDQERTPDLWELMLAALRPDGTGSEEKRISVLHACDTCESGTVCPVRANVRALQHPRVRGRLRRLLLEICLSDRVHLSPRGLWDLAYQALLGGLDRSRIARGEGLATCRDMGSLTPSERDDTLFYNSLFSVEEASGNDWTSAPLRECRALDPGRRFSLPHQVLGLQAALSAEEFGRVVRPIAEELDVDESVFVGDGPKMLSVLRWAHFFHDVAEPQRDKWLSDWIAMLLRRREESRSASIGAPGSDGVVAESVRKILMDIYGVGGRQHLIQVPLPWRSEASVFAEVQLRTRVQAGPDPRVLPGGGAFTEQRRALEQRASIALRAHPIGIPVLVTAARSGGTSHALNVTWPLFHLVMQVNEAGYVAGSLDPERFNQIEQQHKALAAAAATVGPMAVSNAAGILRSVDCDADGRLFIEELPR